MKRATLFFVLLAATVAAVTAATSAASSGRYVCSGGPISAGTYHTLVVTGDCWFGGDVLVTGHLRVEDGAILNDHAFSDAVVRVNGNVYVDKDAVLGLGGYTEGPEPPTGTVVDGSILANQPLSLYLSGITVHGNVVSNGGGGGAQGEFRNFPLKDDVIDGKLVVQGWRGGWLGIIRDQVSGNVLVRNNESVLTETGPGVDSDSTEVQTNTVGGNLVCMHNVPAAQVNPLDLGQPNIVGGHGIGECAGLTS